MNSEDRMMMLLESFMDLEASVINDYLDSNFQFFKGNFNNPISLSEYQNILEWEQALKTTMTFEEPVIENDTLMVQFQKQNLLSNLTNFPGWKGRIVIWLSKHEKIERIMVINEGERLRDSINFKNALSWMQYRFPKQFELIYKDHQFNYSKESAIDWVRILRIWRKEIKKSKAASII